MKLNKPYFVMLRHPSKGFVPMETGEGECFELATFETHIQADRSARDSVLGGALGFEVFKMGDGH